MSMTCSYETARIAEDRDRLAHNLEVEERPTGPAFAGGWLRTEFPGSDLCVRERLVKVVGHRELGDLAELAGAAAVARCGIALGVRSGATGPGPVTGTFSAGPRLGGHAVNLRRHEREVPKPLAETSATVYEPDLGEVGCGGSETVKWYPMIPTNRIPQ